MARIFSKRTLAVLLTLVMMINLLSVSAQAAVTAATETVKNFPDTYYKQDGTAGSENDWEIHLSKTAAPTAQDNIFDITLKIETKDTTIQTAGSTDGAAVLVLDVSNSMDAKEAGCVHEGCKAEKNAAVHCTKYERFFSWKNQCSNCGQTEKQHAEHHTYTQKTQLDSLKAAVADFLDTFAAGAKPGEKRMVAVVAFGTQAKTIQGWVDVNSATALAALKTIINSLSTGNGAYLGWNYLFNGGTNLEGGLVLGRNLLKQTDVLSGIPAENQSLILFSDGAPTAAVSNASSTSVKEVGYAGNDTGSRTDRSDYDDVTSILSGVSAAKIAVVYNYNDDLGILEVPPFTRVISSGADSLSVDLQSEAGKVITNKTNASTVTDPMGTGVSMVSVTTGYDAREQLWDLSKFVPTVKNGITTYTITYQVELDPMAVQLDPAHPGYTVLTPANGATTLNYTYGEAATPVAADFNEPSVRGIRTFTVSYAYVGEVPTGAPEVPEDATYKAGTAVRVADAPALQYYIFSGWDTTDFAMPAEDVVITGYWTESPKYSYELTYVANLGDHETKADAENISGIYATSHNIHVDGNPFVRENYTFIGWNTEADGSGTPYAVSDVVALTSDNNTEILYAQWVENEKYDYSVIYNANFGENKTKADAENISGTYATAYRITVDANSFVRENYTFIGWNTEADGSGTPYAVSDVIALTSDNNTAVLYAQWTENPRYSYSVCYDANFGETPETKQDAENVNDVYDVTYEIAVDENSFVRRGYTFLGWNTEADGSGTAYAAEDVIALTAEENTLALYAQWSINEYAYQVVYMVRVNGNAYQVFAGQLPEGAPVGENAAFGTVIDKEYLDAKGLPTELTDGTYTYSFNAFEGTVIGEEANVVTVYFTCIYQPPVEPPVEIPEEPEEEIEIPEEDVPLDSSPKTGETIPLQLVTAALSGIGLIALLSKKSKKEENAEV